MTISAACVLCQVGYLVFYVCLKIEVPRPISNMLGFVLFWFWALALQYIRSTPYFRSNFSKRAELIGVWGTAAVAAIVIFVVYPMYKSRPDWLLFLTDVIMTIPVLFFSLKLILADKAGQ